MGPAVLSWSELIAPFRRHVFLKKKVKRWKSFQLPRIHTDSPYSSMTWFSKHQEWLSDGKNRSWKLLGWRHSSLGRGGAKFPFGTNAVDELWNTWAVGQSIVPWPFDFQGSRGVGELLRNIEHFYKGRWEEFWFFRHLLERIWNQWQPKLKLWKGLSSNSAQRLLVICHILKSMAWGIEKHAASLAHYVSLDLDPPTGANLLANSITSPGAQVSYHDHSRSLKWNPDSWNMLEPKLCASHTQPTGFYKRSTNTDHSRLITTRNIGKPWHNHVGMDQYLLIPFLGDEHPFTSYFDVHQGYKVLTHCHVIPAG